MLTEADIEKLYHFDEILGQGGFGVVKLATRLSDKSKVAVKVLDRKKIGDKTSSEASLKREVSILQKLNHPNIVRLLQYLETRVHYYLVMELIDGGELFDRIVRRKTYSENDARELCAILLDAIKYMHDRNIVHRDIKPENLMLASKSSDVDVKLVDFGFATEVDGFNLKQYCGSVSYMAPEIVMNANYGKSYANYVYTALDEARAEISLGLNLFQGSQWICGPLAWSCTSCWEGIRLSTTRTRCCCRVKS